MREAAPLILLSPVVLLFSYFWLRHAGLAILVALVPLAGAAAGQWWGAPLLPCYAFGVPVAAWTAAILVNARRSDDTPDFSILTWSVWGAVLPALMLNWRMAAGQAVAVLASGLLLVIASWLPFGENFVARANRAHEKRQLLWEGRSLLAQPGWAFALSGVGLVLGVAAGFRHGLIAAPRDGVSLLVLAAALWAVTRDWRDAVAVAPAAALLQLFTPGALPLFGFYAVGLVLSLRGAGRDEASRARSQERSDGLVFAALAGLGPGLATGSWSALAAPLAGLVLVPSLAVALANLAPPQRNLEDLYG